MEDDTIRFEKLITITNRKKNKDKLYVNPFYDGVMMFLFNKPIPPKQTKGKLKNRKFERYLRNHLLQVSQNKWPVTGKLMICISASGPSSWVDNIDIDNLSKSVLDVLKNLVIEDDSNVFALFAEKRVIIDKCGLMIGIKKISGHEDYWENVIPPYYVDKDSKNISDNIWWLLFDDAKNPEQPF